MYFQGVDKRERLFTHHKKALTVLSRSRQTRAAFYHKTRAGNGRQLVMMIVTTYAHHAIQG